MTLDQFFAERIFGPLGMVDTAFSVPEAEHGRLAALYTPDPATGRARRLDAMGDRALEPPAYLSGGGGLMTTAADYHRFTQMLCGGGELDGVRLLGSRTVRYMASNHLPDGADLTAFGRPLFSETTFDGVGFGLGVSVTVDPVKAKVPGSRRRVRLGRCRQHGVLGRPGRGHDGAVPHPAAAVEHASAALPAEAARAPSARVTAAAPPLVVLWDIDGTLMRSSGVGVRAFVTAIEEVTGRRWTPERLDFGGRTDPDIAALLLAAVGVEDPAAVPAVLDAAGARVRRPRRRSPRDGEGHARRRGRPRRPRSPVAPGTVQTVVTGNLEPVARQKLAAARLADRLRLDVGAYGSDDHADRAALVELAVTRVTTAGTIVDRERVWVVGDTPRDLVAARAAGVRCLLVGTGSPPLRGPGRQRRRRRAARPGGAGPGARGAGPGQCDDLMTGVWRPSPRGRRARNQPSLVPR